MKNVDPHHGIQLITGIPAGEDQGVGAVAREIAVRVIAQRGALNPVIPLFALKVLPLTESSPPKIRQ